MSYRDGDLTPEECAKVGHVFSVPERSSCVCGVVRAPATPTGCPKHGHLPTPFIPKDCEACHPTSLQDDLRGAGLGGVLGTTPATQALLSDIAGTLRQDLGAERARAKALEARIESLEAERSGLKRGLSAAKRDLKRAREASDRWQAQAELLTESLRRMNVEGPK